MTLLHIAATVAGIHLAGMAADFAYFWPETGTVQPRSIRTRIVEGVLMAAAWPVMLALGLAVKLLPALPADEREMTHG